MTTAQAAAQAVAGGVVDYSAYAVDHAVELLESTATPESRAAIASAAQHTYQMLNAGKNTIQNDNTRVKPQTSTQTVKQTLTFN